MKICAVTMVYRDYWALHQWYAHYGAAVGHRNLYVIAHGADPRIAEICPEASVITIPRDDLSGFDGWRSRMLNRIQKGLSVVYDWVIRTDTDELICLDPKFFGSFEEVFENRRADVVFAMGLNLAETAEDTPLQPDESVFSGRRTGVFSGHYSKAWAARHGIPLHLHGAVVPKRQLAKYPYDLPQGVYLVHLKYANLEAMAASNEHRKKIAGGEGSKLPGRAWLKADKAAQEFFIRLDRYRLVDWQKGAQHAYLQHLKEPQRDPRTNVLRSQFLGFEFKVRLPDWIEQQPGK